MINLMQKAQAELEDVESRLLRLRDEMNDLEETAAELRAAIRVFERLNVEDETEKGPVEDKEARESVVQVASGISAAPRMLKRRTTLSLIDQILRTSKTGLTGQQVNQILHTRHRHFVPSNTVSVSLSRLRERGAAELDGRIWRHTRPTSSLRVGEPIVWPVRPSGDEEKKEE